MTIRRFCLDAAISAAVGLTVVTTAGAQLHAVVTFSPVEPGLLCGGGFDPSTGNVWIYACNSATVQVYSPTGTPLFEIARPGESADDFDIEFAPEPLTLGSTPIAEGTLLFINGESGTAEIYAVDKSSGAILESLSTSFGNSHVVGGGYHPHRDTFFLLQDRIPGAAGNMVGEVDPLTGKVLNTFSTIDSGVVVNYGDLDVSTVTGRLLVGSNHETTIAEFTPEGRLVRELELPDPVFGVSGIGIDDQANRLWVSEVPGRVRLLSRYPSPACPGDLDDSGGVALRDLALLLTAWGPCCRPEDLDGNGKVDLDDVTMMLARWGPCV